MTLDKAELNLGLPVDIPGLLSQRSPTLDLDSLYGQGPVARPQWYEADGMHLRRGTPLDFESPAAAEPGFDLPRLADPAVVDAVFAQGRRFFEPAGEGHATMPVEFSGAAFRLGHSVIRTGYSWNRHFNAAAAQAQGPIGSFGGVGEPDLALKRSLASRNLARGRMLGLPSGQQLACALNVPAPTATSSKPTRRCGSTCCAMADLLHCAFEGKAELVNPH